jgi:hypothetical protein
MLLSDSLQQGMKTEQGGSAGSPILLKAKTSSTNRRM